MNRKKQNYGRNKRKRAKKKAGSLRTQSTTHKVTQSKAKGRIRKPKHEQTAEDTFLAVKKSLSDIGKTFSEGADKIADILLNSSQNNKSTKTREIKEELVSMVKDVASGIKRSLKNVKPKDILCKASYEIGKLSRIAKDKSVEIFDDLME